MKINFLKIMFYLIVVCLTFTLFAIIVVAEEKTPEEAAWEKVDGMDPASLESFIGAFPSGKHVNEAKLYLSLQKKIADIKSKKEKPTFAITFDKLGDRWESWKKRMPEKGSLGTFVKKTDFGSTMGVFRALPGKWGVSFDAYGTPTAPTGDGSVVAFRTDGLKLQWIGKILIQCNEGETMYFGVIDNVGLVYLHGKGKVIMPDGKETVLN